MSLNFVPAPSQPPGTPPDEIIPSTEWLNEHDGGRLIAAAVAFVVICPLFVALRFWARRLQQSKVGLDDWLIYAALLACWATQASCIAIVPLGGVGTHLLYWVVTGQKYMVGNWSKYLFPVSLTYLAAVCLSKLALLAIFLRILRDPISRRITFIVVWVVIATWLGETVAALTQCFPIQYQWDKTIPGGYCFNIIDFYKYLSVPNICTDLVILVLPMPTVWKLHTSRTQKLQLMFAFSTGSFGIVSSILRFSNFFTADPLVDPNYNSIVPLTWTVVEPSVYLVCACLPTMRPLFTKSLQVVNRATHAYGSKNSDGPRQPYGDSTPLSDTTRSKKKKPRFGWAGESAMHDSVIDDGMKTAWNYSTDEPEHDRAPFQILRTNDVVVTRSGRDQEPV